MKIGSMPRQQALEVLHGCEQAALATGDHDLSEQLLQDLVLLRRKSRGDTVFEMYENAHRSSLRFEYWASEKPSERIGLSAMAAGALGAAAYAYYSQAPGYIVAAAAVGGLFGGGIAALPPMAILKAVMENRSNTGQLVMEALDRNAPRLASQQTANLPEVSRQQVSDWLKQDQALASDRGELRRALELQLAQRALARDQDMGISELHHWAVQNRNAATATSLQRHVGTLLDREQVKQLMAGNLDKASLEWLEDEIRIGDQTLPKVN